MRSLKLVSLSRSLLPKGGGVELKAPVAVSAGFASDIDAILDEPPPRFLRLAGYLAATFVIVMVVLAAVVKIDVVIQGRGQLSVDVPLIVLQPMERAIIREIDVKVGDVVKKGQVLARLDPTFVDADIASIDAQKRLLQAQFSRVEAEVNNVNFEVADLSDPNLRSQLDLFRQRQEQLASRLRAFDQEIDRSVAVLRTVENDRALVSEQLAIAREVEETRTKLMNSELVTRSRVLDSQTTRLSAEREQQSAMNRLVELRHTIEVRKAERQAFIDEWRKFLYEDMARLRTELAKLKEAMFKAERMRDLILVSAPDDGVVLDVARRSVGSVLREAEPLFTVVPSKGNLVADITINSDDIGYPKVGDTVVVKVDAFPYQRHGMLKGRLQSVSQESYQPQESSNGKSGRSAGAAFHRARIEIIDKTLGNLPAGVQLIPGMTLSAEIKVGTRSVMSYFLQPVTRGLDESIREP